MKNESIRTNSDFARYVSDANGRVVHDECKRITAKRGITAVLSTERRIKVPELKLKTQRNTEVIRVKQSNRLQI